MRFVETPVFTARLHAHLDDESYRALQLALVLRPEQGSLIPGSRGLRKLRWGMEGDLRVIYHWDTRREVAYMLFIYGKNEQGDLTREQVKVLSRLVREELG